MGTYQATLGLIAAVCMFLALAYEDGWQQVYGGALLGLAVSSIATGEQHKLWPTTIAAYAAILTQSHAIATGCAVVHVIFGALAF